MRPSLSDGGQEASFISVGEIELRMKFIWCVWEFREGRKEQCQSKKGGES